MSYKVVSTEIFLRVFAAIAMAVPALLVVGAFVALRDPIERVEWILDGFQWLVLGLGTTLVLRALFVLGETYDEVDGRIWVSLRPESGVV